MGSDPGANTVTPAWIPPSDTAAAAKPLKDTLTPTFPKASPPVPTESVASTVVTDSATSAHAKDTLRAVVAPDTATLKDSADTAKILTANRSQEVVVIGVRPMTAFSRATYTDQDLSIRTQGGDPADVVKVAPGLFTGQHAGGGKANQYFIRGFDCDHGTDLAIWFDGMPVNEPSHAHGQGYADLHFIIPELVDRVQVDKGPYDIQYGDFATAAAISMTTRPKLDENEVYLYGGAFGTDRVVSMLALPGSPSSILATEYYQSDGPFVDPEKNRRFNVFFKNTLAQSANSHLSITLMGYGASWNASGQIPLRAVDSGWIPLYGSEDSSEGGNSQRFSAALNYVHRPDPHNTLRATAYLIDYRLLALLRLHLLRRGHRGRGRDQPAGRPRHGRIPLRLPPRLRLRGRSHRDDLRVGRPRRPDPHRPGPRRRTAGSSATTWTRTWAKPAWANTRCNRSSPSAGSTPRRACAETTSDSTWWTTCTRKETPRSRGPGTPRSGAPRRTWSSRPGPKPTSS
jgi:hypothetical protein